MTSFIYFICRKMVLICLLLSKVLANIVALGGLIFSLTFCCLACLNSNVYLIRGLGKSADNFLYAAVECMASTFVPRMR